MKIRFIEPSNLPYKKSIQNLFTYDKYLRTPSHGIMTLATVVKEYYEDTFAYSESISTLKWKDILDADIVFISIFTFAANRGYELARIIKKNSNAKVVIGGLHATLNYEEAVNYCDYVILGEGEESILDLIKAVKDNSSINFKGIVYSDNGEITHTGDREHPENINIIPNRNLLHNYKKMAASSALWPQVHASRGCPHNCNYCSVIQLFGRKVRTRSPENVIEDILQAIDFYEKRKVKRISKVLWITDDNFFADREWAITILKLIIDKRINYNFTIQARFEVGFDNEMLILLKKAGFIELAMGIEFLENESFEQFNKKSTKSDIEKSIKNIQKHGLNVRGLFIVGADNHTVGVGHKIADFVIKNKICGVLIQSMYFIPGTPVYEINKDKLLHKDWSKYIGHVVHNPASISPENLQKEIIYASKKIYSFKRLVRKILVERGMVRVLFIGEFFWHMTIRKRLKKELKYLSGYKKGYNN